MSIRAEAPRFDGRSDGGHLAREFAVTKSGRSHHHRLADLDRRDIELGQFGAHAQSRDVAQRNERLCRGWRRQFADFGVDLQHGAGNRRTYPHFFEICVGECQFASGRVELTFGLGR